MAARRSTKKQFASAISRGRARASVVFAARVVQQKRRARAIHERPAPRRALAVKRAAGPPAIPPRTRRALGTAEPTALLIAEGDSWFDYPMNDVLGLLEDNHGYDIEAVAHAGDCVEDMAYSGGQFDDFARRLEKLLRKGRVPDAVLISGGGNDIAGDEFAILLNHAASALPVINEDVVRGVIDVRLADAYAFLISGVTELAKKYLDRPIPIITHGYGYPIPDGRGVLGGWGPLPGPWLRPGFHRKGHGNQDANSRVMRELIDSFNAMLKRVSGQPEFAHVHYVDIRPVLDSGGGYKQDWANELHPTKRGFAAVAAKFAAEIAKL